MTTDTDALRRRVEVLRPRIARLCGALLRISASLDLDTVPREVVDGARALTGARRGVITMVDELGRAQRFLSSGIRLTSTGNWRTGPTGSGCSSTFGTFRAR
ncbi:hypothetical protein [Candidatus Palauibacter sp.]|uniref:hypothetical protein n=1 Tax=Candidatus Palauibacter sp. TaxID=3101350 RepID=UPI003B5AA9C8